MAWNEVKSLIKAKFYGATPSCKIGNEVIFLWQGSEWVYDLDTGVLVAL
jgi:hypothetical protein